MSTPVRFTVASVGGSWEDSSSASMSRTWSVLHQQAGSSKPGIPDVVICEFEVLKDADQRKQRIRSRIISCSISSPSPAGVHICCCTSEKPLWFLNKESLNSEWRAVAASPPGLLPHGSLQNLGSFHFSFTWFFPLKTAATSPFYLLNTQARPPAPRSCRQTEAWHWRLAAWVMAISSGDALESRSDEEPSQSLPWNIIALMRPVQQQWLWPRFSLFFFKNPDAFPLWGSWCYACVPACCFIYDTIYPTLQWGGIWQLQATRRETTILFLSYLFDIIARHWEFEMNDVNLVFLRRQI